MKIPEGNRPRPSQMTRHFLMMLGPHQKISIASNAEMQKLPF